MLENVHVIDELLSTDSTTDELKNELQILKGNVMTSLKKVAPTVVRNWEKTHPPNRGPGLHQEGGSQVSLPPAPSGPDPSVPILLPLDPLQKEGKDQFPKILYVTFVAMFLTPKRVNWMTTFLRNMM